VLSADAAASQRHDTTYYAQPANSPENLLLLADDDGLGFIDYLAVLFDEPDDPRPPLRMHRDRIVSRVDRHRTSRRVWERFRWVAEYHNYTCRHHLPDDGDLLVSRQQTIFTFHRFVNRM
jgi:hypothetical protein